MIPAHVRTTDAMRSRSGGFTLFEWIVVIAAFLVILLLAVIAWLIYTAPPPGASIDVPEIYAVQIIPAEIYAAAGTRFTLDTRVMTPRGHIVDVDRYPELTMTWSSATAGLISSSSEDEVVVDLPNTPGVSIRDIVATVERRVGSESSMHPSEPASVHMAPPLGDPASDWVTLHHEPGLRPAYLLIDSRESGAPGCNVDDWIVAGVGTAYFGRNLEDGAGCSTDFAVFQEGSEMIYEDAAFWKSGFEERTPARKPLLRWTSDTSSAPTSKRWFHVVIGLPTVDPISAGIARDEMEVVDVHLNRNRLGLGLREANVVAHGRQNALGVEQGCDTDFLKVFLPDPYLVLDEMLFVFFVEDLTREDYNGVPQSIRGIVCAPDTDRTAEVIYRSLAEHVPSTTAHELGHALALVYPLYQAGHANLLGSFERDNFMWGEEVLEWAGWRSRFTIGQLFRMNLHETSWINLIEPLPATKACQASATTAGACPRVDEDPGRQP